jgi:magnesium-transporting ATPase (P-type)
LIKAGDSVPADLRILECGNLKVLEAMLTGESHQISKISESISGGQNVALGDRKNLAFSATMVQFGTGKGVVVSIGDSTEIGKIGSMVGQQDSMKTNLTVQLEIFGQYFSGIVVIVAVTTFCLAYFKAKETAGDAFQSAMAVAVAIIPGGLPAVVTVSLALSMQFLAKQNAIMKQLAAVETLGSLTVICCDKTGTLTKNEMTVQKIQTSSAQYHVQGVGYSPVGGVIARADGGAIPEELKARLGRMFEGIVLCNDAGLQRSPGPGQQELYTVLGYPTEAALLTLGIKLGIHDLQSFRDSRPRRGAVPFASEHKFMCCVHDDGAGGLVLHVKGAPDRILARCKDQVAGDDLSSTEPLDPGVWEQSVATLSSQGLRCLAVAIAPWNSSDLSADMSADILLGAQRPFLTLVGIVAILDPPRDEAITACGVARTAGIRVKMITGDHPATAVAIAAQLGIVSPGSRTEDVLSLTGPELDRMGDEQLDAVVMKCDVFARASPENKIKIIKALQRVGQTCSMTGDGVNDAPALKAANIGVAMGITGDFPETFFLRSFVCTQCSG